MKKKLLLIVFLSLGANVFGQTCTAITFTDNNLEAFFLDPNNSTRILDIDGNPITDLASTENEVCAERAADVYTLDLSNGYNGISFSNIAGLEEFINLRDLDVSNNNFEVLHVRNLTLERLIANNCVDNTFDVLFQVDPTREVTATNGNSYLVNVREFSFQDNWDNLTSAVGPITFTGVPNAVTANISGSNIRGVIFRADVWNSLEELYANNTSVESLQDVDTAISLRRVEINDSNLSGNLDLTANENLEVFEANEAILSSLTVGDSNVLLRRISIAGQGVTDTTFSTINFNGALPNLSSLDISRNQSLVAVDVTRTPILDSFQMDATAIQELDLTALTITPSNFFLNNNNNNGALTLIDLRNTNVGFEIQNSFIDATGHPNLNCILVNPSDLSDAQNNVANGNWFLDDSSVIKVDCNDQPFEVNASISGNVNGTSPNFTIEEGQTFNLNFNADGTATNGITYTPNISILKNGVDAIDDFTITGLNQPITVDNGQNPDGSIQLIPKEDGDDTGDEVYTISITSENSGEYTIAQPTSFTITVTDRPNNGDPVLLTATLQGTDFDGVNHSIEEGQSFEILIESNNGTDDLIVPIPISFGADGTLDLNNVSTDENPFLLTINNNQNPDGQISINITEDLNVINEGAILEVNLEKPEGNFQWTDNGGFVNKNLQIFIKDREEYSGDPFLLSVDVLGAQEEENDIEEANETFSIEEGNEVEIRLDAILPNAADGFDFQLQFDYFSGNIPSDAFFDYVTFKDAQGNILNFTDENGDFKGWEELVLSVDNSNAPDAVLFVEILPNELLENNYFILKLIPLRPNGFPDPPLINYEGLSATTTSLYQIRFNILDKINSGDINVVFENSGSMEGALDDNGDPIPDILKVTLIDADGEYSNDTGSPITIPFSITIGDEDLIQLPEGFDDLENLSFTIAPEASSGTFEVIYPNDNNEVTDSYSINLGEVEGIIVDTSSIGISIPDKDNYGVDITLQGNLDRDDVLGFGCCYWYNVEQGEVINFLFDAGKGITNTQYDISYEIQAVSAYPNSDFDIITDNLDVSDILIFGESSPINIEAIEGIDNNFTITVKSDLEQEGTVSFGMEFSRIGSNSSLNGGRGGSENNTFFYFQIIESLPLNVEIVNQRNEINEDDPTNNSTILRVFLESPPSESADIDFKVLFNTDGEADENDFTLNSTSTFSYNRQTGDGELFLQKNENGIYEAFITVTASNEEAGEEVNEDDEDIIFTLVDGFGYKIGNQGFQTITIIDDDQADFNLVLDVPEGNETIFEDNTRSTTSFFEVSLLDGATNTSSEPLSINFEIIPDNEGEPQLVTDYRIYDGEPSLGREITNDAMKIVTVETGASKGFIYVVATEDDGEIEEPEAINIRLSTGVGYNLPSPNNTETITIISKEQDTSTLNPSLISATVSSATCPDVSEGEISMTNGSPFIFTVDLLSDSGQRLDTGTLNDFTINPIVLFEDLAPGEYQLKLSTDTPDIFPPNFKLSVRDNLLSTQLVSSSVDKSKNEAELVVSGSSHYEVRVNDRKYEFEFESETQNTLMVPLENGTNEILVDGLAPCQGTLKSTLTLANYKVFPNPSPSKINFSGFTGETRIDCYLFDVSGRLVLSTSTVSNGLGEFELDVASLPQGTYLGQIVPSGYEAVQVKLLKN